MLPSALLLSSLVFSSALASPVASSPTDQGKALLFGEPHIPEHHRGDTYLGPSGSSSSRAESSNAVSPPPADDATSSPLLVVDASAAVAALLGEVADPVRRKSGARLAPDLARRGNRKAGLAWPNGEQENTASWCQSAVGWYYTWSPWNVPTLSNCGQEFVPMFWGPHQAQDWQSQQQSWPSNTKHVLFVNEPNQQGQSQMSPSDAVSLWWQYMEPLKGKYRLGLAGTSSAPSGKQWVQEFISQCNGCSIDFIPLHWYSTSGYDFQAYVTDFYKSFGKPIWVTEWACENFGGGAQCSSDYINNDFFQQTVDWMDSTDWIERHSYFGVMKDMANVSPANQMMDPNSGQPNGLGWKYIS